MADEDESLVVNLDEEEPPEKEEAKTPAAAAETAKPPPVPGPGSAPAPSQTGLAELQRQMQAERADRARLAAENQRITAERDQALAFAQEAERRGMSTYELYNENQITAATDKMAALAAAAESAYAEGDFKRVSAINLELGRVGGTLAVLERDQAVLKQNRDQMAQQPQRRQPQPAQRPQQPAPQPQPTDPLERAIQNRTPQTQQFLRKHRDLVRGDGTLKQYAVDAHNRALDEGFTPDTAPYFEHIERTLNLTSGNGPSVPQRGQAPSIAAPVARSDSSGNLQRGGTFTMTPKMRRLAEEQGVTPQEWAKNYVRLLAEGRITPIT